MRDGIQARGVLRDACFRGRDPVEWQGTTLGVGVLVTQFQELVDTGWPAADLRAAVIEATLLPAGHEDRAPDGPWMLGWLQFRPGRIERLIEAARRRGGPASARGGGPVRIGDLVREIVA